MAKRALCVGINDYPGTWSDLAGCVNDAADWKDALERRGFEVERLLDRAATRQSLIASLRRLVGISRPGDIIVFQFSGHGSWIPDEDGDEPDLRDEVLCPHDIAQGKPLTDDDLHGIFSERRAGVRIVLIADSCHSGTVSRFRRAPAADRGRTRVRFLPPRCFLRGASLRALPRRGSRRAGSPPGRRSALLLSGCQETEFSYDAFFRGRPNGAFTHAALRALSSLRPGATYLDWYQAIRRALPTAEHPQTPSLYGSAAEKGWRALEDGAERERSEGATGARKAAASGRV
jgi:hypothetical protein